MIFDIHVHLCGGTSPLTLNYLSDQLANSFLFRCWSRRMGLAPEDWRNGRADAVVRENIIRQINESCLDRAVLLALDSVHDGDGAECQRRTLLKVDNNYVADAAAAHPKLLFGASVHPYRKDALAELSRLAARGACLVKWLPSAQNINPSDPRCFPFYEALAALRLPLLSHSGVEHALRNFSDELNNPELLRPALERGVTVIAAHCGAHMMLHEKNYFPQWARLARERENFYGDISALAFPLRARLLRKMLRDETLAAKLLFGSDFPAPVMPLTLTGKLGWLGVSGWRAAANPFDRAVAVYRAADVPEQIFSRAEKLLRLPPP